MTLQEYQEQALTTMLTTGDDFKDLLHWVLGINGEAGEVAEKVKKIIRDKNGVINLEDKEELAKEVGDVLWYLAVFANYLDIPLETIAKNNLEKLRS
ncbi:MAG: nucleoside triphosphate pyrophosphohydrolase family protein, partial [Candidatus Saccharimonadales bacterium]